MTNLSGSERRAPRHCERCGRPVQRDGLWTIGISVPPDTRVEREICVVCAADLRRYLLAEPGDPDADVGAAVSGPDASLEVAPAGAFRSVVLHGLGYVAIAVAFFALITLLTLQ
jgi:hypothetical protein